MKHFKFKTLLAMLIFITMSSLIIANGTFIVLTNNMVSLTGENGDISIIVNDGQGKTYEMMGDIGDDISLPFSLSSTDTHHFEGLEVKTTLSYNNKTVTNTEYLFNSSNSYYIEDPLNGNKIKKIEITKVEKDYSSYTMSKYINDSSAPVIKLNYNSSPTSQNSGTAIFDPGANGSGEAINTYVPLSVTNISNKTVKFVLNDGTNYSDETTFTNNPSSASASHAYSAVTAANNLITIVLQKDLTLGSNAKLVLEAQNGVTSGSMSGNVISGKYTALDLNGHTITLENGSEFYANGLVYDSVGTGNVVCQSGSKVYSSFLVEDYGGGGHTTASYLSKSAPFTLFSMPYFNVTSRFYEGSYFYGLTQLYANSTYHRTTIEIIGNSDTSMLEMSAKSSDSYIERKIKGVHTLDSLKDANNYLRYLPYVKYDEIYNINNVDIILNSLSLDLSITTVSMKDVHFPIPPWININILNSSSFSFSQRVDMFPDSNFYCDSSSSTIFNAGAGVMTLNYFLYPTKYTIKPYIGSTLYSNFNLLTDLATIQIDGTLSVANDSNTLGGNITINNSYVSEASKLGDDWSLYYFGQNSGVSDALMKNAALSAVYSAPVSINGYVKNTSFKYNYYDNTYSDGQNTYFLYWPTSSIGEPVENVNAGSYQKAEDVYKVEFNVLKSVNEDGSENRENINLTIAVKYNNTWYINYAGSFVEAVSINNIKISMSNRWSKPADSDYENKNITEYLTSQTFEHGNYQNQININADLLRYSSYKESGFIIGFEGGFSDIYSYIFTAYNSNNSIYTYTITKDKYNLLKATYEKDITLTLKQNNYPGYGLLYFDTTQCLWRLR